MQFELRVVCNSCQFDNEQLSSLPLSVEKGFIFCDSFRSPHIMYIPMLSSKTYNLINQSSAFKICQENTWKS